MNAGQLAGLIAAGFWAVLVCVAVYVLARLARLISAGTRLLAGYRAEAELLTERARAAVQRADEQLARSEAIAASMEEVTASMAELSEQASALAGLARGISAGFGALLVRIPAAVYGVRWAVALRSSRAPGAGAGAGPAGAGPAGAGPAVLPGAPAVPAPRQAAAAGRAGSGPRAIGGAGQRQGSRR